MARAWSWLLVAGAVVAMGAGKEPQGTPPAPAATQAEVTATGITAFAERVVAARKMRKAEAMEAIPQAKKNLAAATAGKVTGANNITKDGAGNLVYTYMDPAAKAETIKGIQQSVAEMQTDAGPLDRPLGLHEGVDVAAPQPGNLLAFLGVPTLMQVEHDRAILQISRVKASQGNRREMERVIRTVPAKELPKEAEVGKPVKLPGVWLVTAVAPHKDALGTTSNATLARIDARKYGVPIEQAIKTAAKAK